MKYPHVVQALYGHPWSILPSAWHAAHQVFVRHLSGKLPAPIKPATKRPTVDWAGEPLEQMVIEDGIAVIPIKGTLINGAGMLEKTCGVVSHDDIREDLDAAVQQGSKAIILDFDTPGGTVNGTPELAEHIREIPVPSIAWTGSLMASAGFWIACGCREIYCAPSATVGSIGCIWETMNMVDQLAADGIEVDVFTSGPFKGMGHPAKRLSDEQRAWMQSTVDSIAADFKDVVTSRRKCDEATMQGQCFNGYAARAAGLVDDNEMKLSDLVEKIAERIENRTLFA